MTDTHNTDTTDQSQDPAETSQSILQYLIDNKRRSEKNHIKFTNDLVDIFMLIKIVHQITVNEGTENSPYDDDPGDALFGAVSFLRQKTHEFSLAYDFHKIAVQKRFEE